MFRTNTKKKIELGNRINHVQKYDSRSLQLLHCSSLSRPCFPQYNRPTHSVPYSSPYFNILRGQIRTQHNLHHRQTKLNDLCKGIASIQFNLLL